MNDRMAFHRDQWDISNMTKNLLGIGSDVVFQLWKNVVYKVTFVNLTGGDRLNRRSLELHKIWTNQESTISHTYHLIESQQLIE